VADGEIVESGVVKQDRARKVEEGADDGEGAEAGDGADAGEAAEAGAAEEAEEDGFGLVIRVMSEEDRGCLLLAGDVTEPAEAAAAGGVFERKMVLAGIGGDINACSDERNAMRVAEGGAGFGVGITGGAAEEMIEMYGDDVGGELACLLMQHVQEHC